ncbi:MAG: methyltransferase domain-containing protein [Thaumarchaeota archaeon]|nr:methyltransferase domain-containing protein [Nitrososphaerota archaeon]
MAGNDFFDSYQDFFETSSVGIAPNRLKNRYRALIANNVDIIKNSTVLDLASHDGRWSFACLMNGASRVIGIEGRRDLAKNGEDTMKKYGISAARYSFIVGDLFEEIGKVREKIDVVLCFGIFYHVMNHMLLLSSIKQISPRYLLLDSAVSASDDPVIELRLENIRDPAAAIKANTSNRALVGWPSRKALELMLVDIGYNFKYYDWANAGITNWEDIEDYRDGRRVSLVARNTGPP